MDAFKTVTEVTSYGATNAKRTWQRMQKEPAPTQANYYSEGRVMTVTSHPSLVTPARVYLQSRPHPNTP